MTDIRVNPLRELVEARREEIKEIVARHGGRSVAIFGSVARGEEHPGSDIDFLVELNPDARPIEILSIGIELEGALGVRVDVGTPASLREHRHDRGPLDEATKQAGALIPSATERVALVC